MAVATGLVIFALYFTCVYLLPTLNCEERERGVLLAQAVTCLQVLRAAPAFAGLVLTEVNPTHDPAGGQLARYVDAIVATIAGQRRPA